MSASESERADLPGFSGAAFLSELLAIAREPDVQVCRVLLGVGEKQRDIGDGSSIHWSGSWTTPPRCPPLMRDFVVRNSS